jgi:hypothetical protein
LNERYLPDVAGPPLIPTGYNNKKQGKYRRLPRERRRVRRCCHSRTADARRWHDTQLGRTRRMERPPSLAGDWTLHEWDPYNDSRA